MHEGLIGEIQISSCSWLQITGSTPWMIDTGQLVISLISNRISESLPAYGHYPPNLHLPATLPTHRRAALASPRPQKSYGIVVALLLQRHQRQAIGHLTDALEVRQRRREAAVGMSRRGGGVGFDSIYLRRCSAIEDFDSAVAVLAHDVDPDAQIATLSRSLQRAAREARGPTSICRELAFSFRRSEPVWNFVDRVEGIRLECVGAAGEQHVFRGCAAGF